MTHITDLFCVIQLVRMINGAVYNTNIIWSTSSVTYYRPAWSGNVSINYTEWVGDIPGQIWKVEGIILPISTSGRPSAPNPYNGYPTGQAYGLDKGHLMALSHGGADISLNIVPQAPQWQQSGGWAQMEKNVYNFALYKYGWKTISHASDIAYVSKPNSCNVVFIVQPKTYNLSNGQPLLYTGSVSCGADLYTFTITPIPGSDTAVWIPHSPPSSSIDKNNSIKGWAIAMIVIGIIIFFGILFVAYKYKKQKLLSNETKLLSNETKLKATSEDDKLIGHTQQTTQ